MIRRIREARNVVGWETQQKGETICDIVLMIKYQWNNKILSFPSTVDQLNVFRHDSKPMCVIGKCRNKQCPCRVAAIQLFFDAIQENTLHPFSMRTSTLLMIFLRSSVNDSIGNGKEASTAWLWPGINGRMTSMTCLPHMEILYSRGMTSITDLFVRTFRHAVAVGALTNKASRLHNGQCLKYSLNVPFFWW